MKDDPVPVTRRKVFMISSARNEYEPFLLVLRPEAGLNGVMVAEMIEKLNR